MSKIKYHAFLMFILFLSSPARATELLIAYAGSALDRGISEADVSRIVEEYLFGNEKRTFDVRTVPAGRVFKILSKKGNDYCSLGVGRTEEREDLFNWVMTVERVTPILIAAPNEASADPVNNNVIVVNSTYYEIVARQNNWKVMTAPNRDSAYQMFKNSRARLLFDSKSMVDFMNSYDKFEYRIIEKMSEKKGWLACNKVTSEKNIEIIKKAIINSIKSGKLSEMSKKYFTAVEYTLD